MCREVGLGAVESNRLGEEKLNNQGSIMKIIKYNGNKDILVEFQDYYKYTVHTDYRWFSKGKVKNVYAPSLLGIGFLGESCIYDNNKKLKKSYDTWAHMIKRCYDKKYKLAHQTYEFAEICNDWLNYSNFEKWFNHNYYEIDDEKMELDKDILVKGNKLYSPETCIFIPHIINSLLTKSDSRRGKYPIGVSYYKRYNNYVSHCNIDSKRITIGYFDTIADAFLSYKKYKETYIKQIAKKYKHKIPNNAYTSLINYSVEEYD